jgi:RNA polymerase sigma-70 factor, ECF subfamily
VACYDDPEAYVRRVAFNLAKSQWRRLKRIVQGSPPEIGQESPDRDSYRDLISALQSIPATEREAIVRHYLADEPIDRIAREMKVPPGTVKSWLSRGRSRLAELPTLNDALGVTAHER